MKKIPFNVFEEGQTIYFDITRLEELENSLGMPINAIVTKQETGIGFCLKALQIGLKHHYRRGNKDLFASKMEEHFDNDGTLEEIVVPIIRAIMGSGVFGKEAINKIEQKVAEDEEGNTEKNVQGTVKKSKASPIG